MQFLILILFVFALVLAIIAGALNPPEPSRGRLLCYAVACMAAAFMIQAGASLPVFKR